MQQDPETKFVPSVSSAETDPAMQQQIAELQALLAQQSTKLSQAEQEIEGYRQALERQMLLKHEIERKAQSTKQKTKRDIARIQKELDLYRAQLREVYASRSWRLSFPVRRVTSLLKGGSAVTDMERYLLAIPALESVQLPALENPGEAAEREARTGVRATKSRMLKLGFLERAYADMQAFVEQRDNQYLSRLAAWELAVWHANRYTQEDACRGIDYLGVARTGERDPDILRRATVLEAECMRLAGDPDSARAVLEKEGEVKPHADLFLGLCALVESESERIGLINRALAETGLEPIELSSEPANTIYDRMKGVATLTGGKEGVRVTVIVPSYNAEGTIDTTLRALTAQTWQNLEIIVADDSSSDTTCAVVERWMQVDSRVHLVACETNCGPYVARNRALQVATGALVTCNDADDWSHPRKIELQARHLIDNPECIANTSEQARVSEDLEFYRRGNAGFYIQPNMSSLMFWRIEVVSKIGYWDSVRFAADSEFTRRIKRVFGADAIVDLPTGPLSFQRQTGGSLTGSATFGYHGFKMGARREYELGHKRFHSRKGSLYIDFPLQGRPFVVPEPMRPHRNEQRVRKFDVVIVSDFRMPGGTSMSNVEEIKAQRRLGLRTGLVQMSRYDVNPDRDINPAVQALIDGDKVDLIVYGEEAACDLMILRLPWVLEEFQEYIPQVDAREIAVIVNQPPKRDYADDSPYIYHLQRCKTHLQRYFGKEATWFPIGPLVRDALLKHHADELEGIVLSDQDWSNIIDIHEWRRPLKPAPHARIRICRVSRDQYVKWPDDLGQLLQIYPDSNEFEVHILGGATTPQKVLARKLPKRWHVIEFGKVHPARFLAKFDVFVYYTHPHWVESFGRVIFEAMAVGLPVFLPSVYQPLFKDAAIYAEPHEVAAKVKALMTDQGAYDAQVRRALEFVQSRFGHAEHARRIGHVVGALTPERTNRVLAGSEYDLSGEAASLTSLDEVALERIARGEGEGALLRAAIVAAAEEAMARGPYSVVHKTSLPPSGDPHDYWHPAPYWWPNPETIDGLPYIRRDGERVPGTLMYDPDSNQYDRTRVQWLFDDSLTLMLAWRFTRREAFAEKAAAHLYTFFVDPDTRMNPHLEYAQVKMGHNGDRGSSSGIIELKDFYYYLDAVRLMEMAGVLSSATISGFRAWLGTYLRWLLASSQGRTEQQATNNHGTYYDLQVAAISAYLDERTCLFQTLLRARRRLPEQFAADGSQPEELTRQTTAHYCCYNMQGWINLSRLAHRWGADLWEEQGAGGGRLQAGVEWLLSHMGRPWPYRQIDAFDPDRFLPIAFDQPVVDLGCSGLLPSKYTAKAIFHPHDGVRPYWNIG